MKETGNEDSNKSGNIDMANNYMDIEIM